MSLKWRIVLLLYWCGIGIQALSQPSQQQRNALRSIKCVQIVVEESYGKGAEGVNLPFEEAAKVLLTYAGREVVEGEAKDCAVMKIQARGKLFNEEALPKDRIIVAGTSIEGKLVVEIPGEAPIAESFGGMLSTTGTPLESLFRDSFMPRLLDLTTEVYGSGFLVAALRDERPFLRQKVAEVLGRAKDAQAVEALIAALSDPDQAVQDSVSQALRSITGQELGKDRAKWQEWANKNLVHTAHTASGDVTLPNILSKVEPSYTEEARKAKVQGTVTLSFIVDTEGHPVDIKVVKSLHPSLDQEAVETLRKWVFAPGRKDGVPVAVEICVEFTFKLF